MEWENRARKASVLAAGLAALGLLVSGVFSYLSVQFAGDALQLSRESADRQISSKVFLGEALVELQPDGSPRRVVSNANAVDVYGVWVEGQTPEEEAAMVRIWTVQACTGYMLPPPEEFKPSKVHFFDGTFGWVRYESGELERESPVGPPETGGERVAMDAPGAPFRVRACGS